MKLEECQVDLKTSREKIKRLEIVEAQSKALKNAHDKALDLAEQHAVRTKELQKQVEMLREDIKPMEEKIKNTAELEAEIARLKGHCVTYKKNVCALNIVYSLH